MENTLQTLEDFVLKRKLDLGIGGLTYEDLALDVIKLAEFLKSTPQIKHFIECDENGVPMKPYIKSTSEDYWDKNNICRVISKKERQFIIAQKQVLFEGWKVENSGTFFTYIENKDIPIILIFENKTGLIHELKSYSDLTKCQLQTNTNFKELIYGK